MKPITNILFNSLLFIILIVRVLRVISIPDTPNIYETRNRLIPLNWFENVLKYAKI